MLFKDGKFISKKNAKKNVPNIDIHAIFQDSKGQTWIGTKEGFSKGKDLNHLNFSGMTNESIITFYELKNGNICLGTQNGAFIVNPEGKLLKKLDRKAGFFGKEVRSFYEDRKGKLWIGSYNGGLYCYHKNKFTSINLMSNCKLPLDIFTLAKDKNSMIYFTGNLGLNAVSEEKLNEFYSGKIDYLIPLYYGEETGIYNSEFNGGFQNNFLKDGDNFYFPTIEGINLLKTNQRLIKKQKPFFKSIHINNKLSNFKNNKFKAETYTIVIEFNAANYNSKNNVYYQHKLSKNGQKNHPWSSLQKSNSITFDLLGAGKYSLSVRALDGYNDTKPQIIHYDFEIQPYFYQSRIFYIITALILIIFTWYVVKLRIRILQKKQKLNFQINNKIVELKLEAIQSKMNPHFIFNTLNNT